MFSLSPSGRDWCAAGGYHGNGQRNSEDHTSLFLCKMATLQRKVMSNYVPAPLTCYNCSHEHITCTCCLPPRVGSFQVNPWCMVLVVALLVNSLLFPLSVLRFSFCSFFLIQCLVFLTIIKSYAETKGHQILGGPERTANEVPISFLLIRAICVLE